MVRITDLSDMTSAVYRGHKSNKQKLRIGQLSLGALPRNSVVRIIDSFRNYL